MTAKVARAGGLVATGLLLDATVIGIAMVVRGPAAGIQATAVMTILVAAARQGQPVSALVAALPPRFTASDRLKDFPTEQSRTRIQALSGDVGAIEAAFGQLCGKVKVTGTTDGLRIGFANGEIVQL